MGTGLGSRIGKVDTMVTKSHDDEKSRTKRLTESNPQVDASKVEGLQAALDELRALGIQPKGFNLLAPTDSAHTHSHADSLDNEDGLNLSNNVVFKTDLRSAARAH